MQNADSGLPDLTIWDSIRDCANSALSNLVSTIEAEIASDKTLADLRDSGSLHLAIESRARDWMARAYKCCLSCWLRWSREESAEFRRVVCVYRLSPFFSKEMLRLLRLATGLSKEAVLRIEAKMVRSPREDGLLRIAGTVWSKLYNQWPNALPPLRTVQRPSLGENQCASHQDEVDAFLARVVSTTGHKATKTDLWRVAGYNDRREFERFQRGELPENKSATESFQRVLSMSPETFVEQVKKRATRK